MDVVGSSLALLLAAQAAASGLTEKPASLAQIGEDIFTAQMCEAFGYVTDWQGLGNWAEAQRDALVAADPLLTSTAAQSEIEDKVASHTKVVYAVYWEGGARGQRSDEAIEKQYRFVNLFRKKCDRLVRSPETGQYVTPPEQNPDASQIIARISARFEQARTSR